MHRLPHGADDHGEEQREARGIHGVHERGVCEPVQGIRCLLHVRAVNDAADELVCHGLDLRGHNHLSCYEEQQLLGCLLHLLARIAYSLPQGLRYLRHQEAQLPGAAIRLLHAEQGALQHTNGANLDLPLAPRGGAEVREEHGQHKLRHGLAPGAHRAQLRSEVHSAPHWLGLQLCLLQEDEHRGQGRQHCRRVPKQRPDSPEAAVPQASPLDAHGQLLHGSEGHAGNLVLDLTEVGDAPRASRQLLLCLCAVLHSAVHHTLDLAVQVEGTVFHGALRLLGRCLRCGLRDSGRSSADPAVLWCLLDAHHHLLFLLLALSPTLLALLLLLVPDYGECTPVIRVLLQRRDVLLQLSLLGLVGLGGRQPAKLRLQGGYLRVLR
mmetsp:Transcript_87833/g.284318  ORF Transcript_87833/g.284318 Transcript_87833/m.284318 type:complete len:380 (-) Transcript_87833:304-1443(-)